MKKVLLTLVSGLFLSLGFAQAQEGDDYAKWQIRVRGVGVVPIESSEVGKIGGSVGVSSTFVPEIDFTYFFTKNLAAELILATSKHKINTQNSNLASIGGATNTSIDLGHVWLLPPTLTLQYHFHPSPVWKPYVGVGANYTIFYNEDAGPTVQSVSYKNKFGLAAQLGVDVNISKSVFLNLDIKQIFLKTNADVDATNLAPGLTIPAKVTLNPFLLGFGIGVRL